MSRDIDTPCPDPEQLFVDLAEDRPEARAHLAECPDCADMVESHRQLEKDLLRLSDPLPPPDFVHRVMARVEAQPVPAGNEWLSFGGIVAAALAGLVVLLGVDVSSVGAWGTQVASWAVGTREVVEAAANASLVIWETAALPITASAATLLATAAMAARRIWAPASASTSRRISA